jgi:hypothetical protein
VVVGLTRGGSPVAGSGRWPVLLLLLTPWLLVPLLCVWLDAPFVGPVGLVLHSLPSFV